MFKAIDKWLPGYVMSRLSRPRFPAGTRHLFFCVADHFEPFRGTDDPATALALVRSWCADYPGSVRGFCDADGRQPQHTLFYPQEEYSAAVLDTLAGLCRDGFGEVEVHLHHRHDTPDGLRQKLTAFRDTLHRQHGLLGCERVTDGGARSDVRLRPTADPEPLVPPAGAIRYGFIHGNWALCNSRPDGDWCGVNEELGILAGTGCYADFTFPSAPSPTQSCTVNAIYRATDVAGRPRGADRGVRVVTRGARDSHRPQAADQRPDATFNVQRSTLNAQVCSAPPSDSDPQPSTLAPLMIVQGPLALNWRRRKWGVLPRLENAEITGANPPTRERLRLWAGQQIGVGGRPDWVFVKVHTHGCVPANRDVVLGSAMSGLHGALQREFNDGQTWRLHYVTAREMYNLIRAAEDGWTGEPGEARDWEVTPPPACE